MFYINLNTPIIVSAWANHWNEQKPQKYFDVENIVFRVGGGDLHRTQKINDTRSKFSFFLTETFISKHNDNENKIPTTTEKLFL